MLGKAGSGHRSLNFALTGLLGRNLWPIKKTSFVCLNALIVILVGLLVPANVLPVEKQSKRSSLVKRYAGLREEILAKAERCLLAIPSIFDRASPAVVYIFTTSVNP